MTHRLWTPLGAPLLAPNVANNSTIHYHRATVQCRFTFRVSESDKRDIKNLMYPNPAQIIFACFVNFAA